MFNDVFTFVLPELDAAENYGNSSGIINDCFSQRSKCVARHKIASNFSFFFLLM